MALSSLLSLLLFAGMQIYSRQLASTEWLTIQGGLLGSGLFVFSLTVSSTRWKGRWWCRNRRWAGMGGKGFAFPLLPGPVFVYEFLLNSVNPGLQ